MATSNTSRTPYAINQTESFEVDVGILWTLVGAFLVFFMQCGFAMLEAGTVRKENTINILLKNLVDSCVAALIWWSVGYPLAFGDGFESLQRFVGGSNFFMLGDIDVSEKPEFYSHWIFQWAFATTAATIVSGALAERCQFRAYVLFTMIITSVVYPIIVHWVWSDEDYAGSSVVHVTGGGAALLGARIIGPRLNRFTNGGREFRAEPNNLGFSLLGTLILWFGWYGFNPTSGMCVKDCMVTASLAAVNTTIAAATGGVTVLLLHFSLGRIVHLAPGLNGILSGLVAITAGCSVVEPYAAFIIGFCSSCAYYGASHLLRVFHIDDPLDASSVHFVSGIVGTVAVGLFATRDHIQRAYFVDKQKGYDVGLFYGGDGTQLGVQILGTLVISAYTCLINYVLFTLLNRFDYLRVPEVLEMPGLDVSIHGRRTVDSSSSHQTHERCQSKDCHS